MKTSSRIARASVITGAAVFLTLLCTIPVMHWSLSVVTAAVIGLIAGFMTFNFTETRVAMGKAWRFCRTKMPSGIWFFIKAILRLGDLRRPLIAQAWIFSTLLFSLQLDLPNPFVGAEGVTFCMMLGFAFSFIAFPGFLIQLTENHNIDVRYTWLRAVFGEYDEHDHVHMEFMNPWSTKIGWREWSLVYGHILWSFIVFAAKGAAAIIGGGCIALFYLIIGSIWLTMKFLYSHERWIPSVSGILGGLVTYTWLMVTHDSVTTIGPLALGPFTLLAWTGIASLTSGALAYPVAELISALKWFDTFGDGLFSQPTEESPPTS